MSADDCLHDVERLHTHDGHQAWPPHLMHGGNHTVGYLMGIQHAIT